MRRTLLIIIAMLLPAFLPAKDFVLVIDAGHGGKDPGALGRTAKEKNINLNVALAFGKLVEQNCRDVKVVYTRKTDTFLTLDGRAEIANKAKADLFISIHTNALPRGRNNVRGTETYTLGMHRADDNLEVAKRENSAILIESDYKTRYQGFDPSSSESYIIFEVMQDRNMKQSVSFAQYMQSEFRSAGRKDKGVHQAGFLVLRATSMPSALIELGYISTPDEEQFLASASGVNTMGRAIYKAFLTYKNKQKPTTVTPSPAAQQQQPTTAQQPQAKPAQQSTPAPQQQAKPAQQPKAAQQPQTTAQPQPADTATAAPVLVTTPIEPEGEITYRVQFAVGRNLVKTFKNISAFEYYREGELYKYTTGRFANFAQAKHLCNQVSKTYSGAFVVAFKGETRITIDQARNNKK